MPKLKQPTPLQNAAMDALVGFLTSYCSECISNGSLDKIHRGIAVIKKDICPHVPWHFSSEFHDRFLRDILLPKNRPAECPDSHKKAVLEIIMDKKIIGLKCVEGILNSLDILDAHRIRGIRNLSVPCHLKKAVPHCLRSFHLEDLTSLTFERKCTDIDLDIIGQKCPKLEFLNFSASDKVTDEGLRALGPCAELRVVRLSECPRVSHCGINDLISVHKKIRKVFAYARNRDAGFDCFSSSDSSSYPTINSFTIVSDRISNEHLQSVVKRFPNLTSLRISGQMVGDLCVLKALSKLSQLDLSSALGFTWHNLRELLTLIGGNIAQLQTCTISDDESIQALVTQSDLNFVFEVCGGIEYLSFVYEPPLHVGELVIPPFPKLKALSCFIPGEYAYRIAKIEFRPLLELVDLTVCRFDLTAEILESIILDNRRFPNLKLMKLYDISCYYEIDDLRKIAKNRNLDFYITEDSEAPS